MALTNSVSDVLTKIRGFIKDQARTDGRDAFEYQTDNKFTLSESFVDADSLRVLVNGESISQVNFEFDSDTNQVAIDFETSGDDLQANDTVLILYSFFKKYSDTELEGYLSSALGYFSLHRYKKTFEIEDDEIVALNDEAPDENELYFISIIASILIDPQNIRMRTPEFELSANRNESDQEQIKKAFAVFKRMIGNVSFDIIEFERNWFI